MADDLSPVVREQLARAIHERYRRNQHGRKPPEDPAMKPWDELSETLKHSNRDQASDISRKLHAIGCMVCPARDGDRGFAFTRDELEQLAILEHARWVAERVAAGWTAGPTTDVADKITPYLVSWDDLADEIREYDREAVRAIPEVVRAAGLSVYRREL